MAGISFPGLGSGLQVTEIVNAIVNAEKVPYETRAARQQGAFTTDISAIGALKSALEAVNSTLSSLGDVDQYLTRDITGRDDFIGLSSNKDAEIGSYNIKVNSLSSNHKLLSPAFGSEDAIGEGTLTVKSGETFFDIAVSATATIEEIRDTINDSLDNDAVTATIITDDAGQHLVLSSNKTGVENVITVIVDDVSDGVNTDNSGLSRLAYEPEVTSPNYAVNMQVTSAAEDASITIDGTIVVSNSTNVFEKVIDGVDITAKKVHGVDDGLSDIKVTENNNNVASGLTEFIGAYNALLDINNQLGQVGENGTGPLAGDSLLRNVMNNLRSKFNEGFETSTDENLTFAELGIRTERSGKLSLDRSTLDDFLDKNPERIQSFFIGTDNRKGFAEDVQSFIGIYAGSEGIIQQRIDGKNRQIDKLASDMEKFQEKMTSLESRLFAQYNSMDLVVAQMNSTSSFLQSQLENMPGVVKKS